MSNNDYWNNALWRLRTTKSNRKSSVKERAGWLSHREGYSALSKPIYKITFVPWSHSYRMSLGVHLFRSVSVCSKGQLLP